MKLAHLLESESPYGYSRHQATDEEHETCDLILSYMTRAHRVLSRMTTDMISPEGKQKLDSIYNSWRKDLMHGDLEAWKKAYDDVSAKHVDAFDFFMDEVFVQAGLGHEATFDDFAAKVGLKDY